MFAKSLSHWLFSLVVLNYSTVSNTTKTNLQQPTTAVATASVHKETDADTEFWQFPCKQQL